MKPSRAVAVIVLALLPVGARPARATTVDGALDSDYGATLAIQTTQSTIKGYPLGEVDQSVGSELDGAYGYIGGGALHLFLAGNLSFSIGLEGGISRWLPIDVFVDSKDGGQNPMLGNNPNIDPNYDFRNLAGLGFDTEFTADYLLSLGGNFNGWPKVFAYYAELPTAGGGTGSFLGNTLCGGDGTLTDGTNPFGIQLAVVDSNTMGVKAGCGVSSGAGVATGIEWSIPLAAIGDPTGCVKVCAFVVRPDHGYLYNQVLGSLPPSTCDLGAPATVNFAALAGAQYFTVCAVNTPTRRATWGTLKTLYRDSDSGSP